MEFECDECGHTQYENPEVRTIPDNRYFDTMNRVHEKLIELFRQHAFELGRQAVDNSHAKEVLEAQINVLKYVLGVKDPNPLEGYSAGSFHGT